MNGLSITDQDELKQFCTTLFNWQPEGSHDSGTEIRGELGTQMKKLFFMSLDCPDLDICLNKIRVARQSDLTLEEWKEQYRQYLLLIAQRQEYIERYNRTKSWYQSKLDDIEPLNESNWNIWGSIRQMKFGYTVAKTLGVDLDPVFGALLSPTGGIVGAGNQALIQGDDQDPIVMHGIVHDAGGYLYNYHQQGPGYNYLGTWWTLFPTSSPFSTQGAGVSYWGSLIDEIQVESEEEPEETYSMMKSLMFWN